MSPRTRPVRVSTMRWLTPRSASNGRVRASCAPVCPTNGRFWADLNGEAASARKGRKPALRAGLRHLEPKRAKGLEPSTLSLGSVPRPAWLSQNLGNKPKPTRSDPLEPAPAGG